MHVSLEPQLVRLDVSPLLHFTCICTIECHDNKLSYTLFPDDDIMIILSIVMANKPAVGVVCKEQHLPKAHGRSLSDAHFLYFKYNEYFLGFCIFCSTSPTTASLNRVCRQCDKHMRCGITRIRAPHCTFAG